MTRVVRAPELDGGLAWLNAPRPLSMRELASVTIDLLDVLGYAEVDVLGLTKQVNEALEKKVQSLTNEEIRAGILERRRHQSEATPPE